MTTSLPPWPVIITVWQELYTASEAYLGLAQAEQKAKLADFGPRIAKALKWLEQRPSTQVTSLTVAIVPAEGHTHASDPNELEQTVSVARVKRSPYGGVPTPLIRSTGPHGRAPSPCHAPWGPWVQVVVPKPLVRMYLSPTNPDLVRACRRLAEAQVVSAGPSSDCPGLA